MNKLKYIIVSFFFIRLKLNINLKIKRFICNSKINSFSNRNNKNYSNSNVKM